MKRDEAYKFYRFGNAAKLIADNWQNAKNAIRYLSRLRKEKGITAYRISISPIEKGRSSCDYRRGISIDIAAGIAYPQLAELMKTVRDESKKQLDELTI